MAAGYELQKRSISLDGKETTIAIEQLYWKALDDLARAYDTPWRKYLAVVWATRPTDYRGSRAGWLRYFVLKLKYGFLVRLTQENEALEQSLKENNVAA